MRKFYGISAVVLCFAVLLAGCGGGGGGTVAPTGTTISGTVSAPSGVALGRTAGRSASATGLVAKASVSVEVYLIDDSGNKSGSTLVTATSNASGVYSLTLPVGTSAASNLVVVVGTGNNQMRSITTSTTVNINPLTELVTSKVVASSQPLSNFTTTEIAAIQTQVETNAQSIDLSSATTVSEAKDTLYTGDVAANLDAKIVESGAPNTADSLSFAYAYAQVYHYYVTGEGRTAKVTSVLRARIQDGSGNDISGATITVTKPDGTSVALTGFSVAAGDSQYVYGHDIDDVTFQTGTYTFNASFGGKTASTTFNLTSNADPGVQFGAFSVTSTSISQTSGKYYANSDEDITMSWNISSGTCSSYTLWLDVSHSDAADQTQFLKSNITTTSYSIPANSLRKGTSYDIMVNCVDNTGGVIEHFDAMSWYVNYEPMTLGEDLIIRP